MLQQYNNNNKDIATAIKRWPTTVLSPEGVVTCPRGRLKQNLNVATKFEVPTSVQCSIVTKCLSCLVLEI